MEPPSSSLPRRYANPDSIIEGVCDVFGVLPIHIKSSKRTQSITIPRQVACFLMSRHTIMSNMEIARAVGCKNNTSSHYAKKGIAKRMEDDPEFAATVELCMANVFEGGSNA